MSQHVYRGSKVVIHIGSNVIMDKDRFEGIMDDISILHLLGVQLILIAGVRAQIDLCTSSMGQTPEYKSGIRVTDEIGLRCLKVCQNNSNNTYCLHLIKSPLLSHTL